MTNNTIKVTPGSRGNFSKLRKYKTGGDIPMYQTSTTSEGVLYISNDKVTTGITHKKDTTWKSHVFNQFMNSLVAHLRTAKTREERHQIVQAINEMQRRYAELRLKYPNLSPVKFDDLVRQYQLDIIDKYPYVNTEGINYGLQSATLRYIKPKGANTSDRGGGIGTTWKADGRFSGQTYDRTILGWEGDYDVNTGENGPIDFAAWRKQLNDMGYDIRLPKAEEMAGEGDKAYRLDLFDAPNLPAVEGPDDDNSEPDLNEGPEVEKPNPDVDDPIEAMRQRVAALQFDPVDYSNFNPKELKDWNTAPLWNGALLGDGLRANDRVANRSMGKTMVRPLPPQVHGQWNDDYTFQTMGLAQIGKNNSLAASLAAGTSNGRDAMDVQLEMNKNNDNLAMLMAEHRANKYEQEYQRDDQKADLQSQYNTQAYNTGQDRAVAMHNYRIDVRNQQDLANAELKQQNLLANRQEGEAFNRMNWLNYRGQYDSWLNKNYLDAATKIRQDYADSNDITKMQAFQDFYGNSAGAWTKSNDFGVAYNNFLSANKLGKGDANSFATFIQNKDYWGDKDLSRMVNPLLTQFNQQKESAGTTYLENMRKLEAYKQMKNDQFPLQYSGQHTIQGYMGMNPHLYGLQWNFNPNATFQYKQGGSVNRKDRFLLYMEHNQKGEIENKKNIHNYYKDSQQLTLSGLNAIEREKLLLLRQIFKG